MKLRNGYTNSIAKERLRLMIEAEPIECSPEQMNQLKKEVAGVVGKYFDLDPDTYEIKIVLKQNSKRA